MQTGFCRYPPHLHWRNYANLLLVVTFDISLSDYFSFIQDKTGELFKASCQAGAYLAGHSEHVIEQVGGFGLSLGLNYQIFDDLIDSFGESTVAGKCLGTDFDSGKVTLPIILLFQKLSTSQVRMSRTCWLMVP